MHDAAQHKPRPLPMFLSMLRSETAGDDGRMQAAMAGLRRFQTTPRRPPPPAPPIVARAGRAVLRDFGGEGPPLVVVPSLINPPDVLDLDEERSLLRWLAGRGLRPLLVEWGTPDRQERDLTIAQHVETLLLPLIDALGERPLIAGYCLGGTMAIAAAVLRRPLGLALLASPWRFRGYPLATHVAIGELWAHAQRASETLGLMPMEVLQAAFWRMDPRRTIEKYVALGRWNADDPAIDRFVRLEDWANDGPPLTHAAASELFHDLFVADLTGHGRWRVGGRAIRLQAVRAPVLQLISTTDRIVPAAASPRFGERREVTLGHVGMIVGGSSREAVWEPLAAWLSAIRPSW